MANLKQYAYFLKGNKIAIVENDITPENDPTSRDYGPGARSIRYKSPTETVADGIEIEYAYSPKYHIDETDDKNTALDTYISLDGLLKLIDSASDNYSASPESLSDGSYIVLRKAGKWNGLHKVKAAGVGYITTYTKYSGSASVEVAFEESPELYYNVSALVDESSDVPIPDYLSKAVVYYVKAKMAEDKADYKSKEYFMKQFKQMVEKKQSATIWGPRVIVPGAGSIR